LKVTQSGGKATKKEFLKFLENIETHFSKVKQNGKKYFPMVTI